MLALGGMAAYVTRRRRQPAATPAAIPMGVRACLQVLLEPPHLMRQPAESLPSSWRSRLRNRFIEAGCDVRCVTKWMLDAHFTSSRRAPASNPALHVIWRPAIHQLYADPAGIAGDMISRIYSRSRAMATYCALPIERQLADRRCRTSRYQENRGLQCADPLAGLSGGGRQPTRRRSRRYRSACARCRGRSDLRAGQSP